MIFVIFENDEISSLAGKHIFYQYAMLWKTMQCRTIHTIGVVCFGLGMAKSCETTAVQSSMSWLIRYAAFSCFFVTLSGIQIRHVWRNKSTKIPNLCDNNHISHKYNTKIHDYKEPQQKNIILHEYYVRQVWFLKLGNDRACWRFVSRFLGFLDDFSDFRDFFNCLCLGGLGVE